MTPCDVVRLQSYVRTHIGEIAGAEDLARQLNLPYENLRKTFRRCTSQTLGHFIEQVRVDEAKRLLVDTDLLCFEVALHVGYIRDDVAMRAFRRNAGMSMQQYRELERTCLRRDMPRNNGAHDGGMGESHTGNATQNSMPK